MEKIVLSKVDKPEDKCHLADEEIKKIADLFTLLIQIDKRQKEKENDRHN